MSTDPKQPRKPRHEELFVAVNECLSNAADKLEALRDTIVGSEKSLEVGEAPSPPTPSPAEVYENVPGRIRAVSGQICDLTADIRSMVV